MWFPDAKEFWPRAERSKRRCANRSRTPIRFEALAFRASRGEADTYELTKVRKDGSRFPASVSISALRDDGNAIVGYLMVASDNTARRLAESKLRVSEIRYRRLFETAHDGVLLLDPATRKITDANPFMTMLLGYSHAQLVGKELFEIGLFKDELASQTMVEKLRVQHLVRYENLPLKSQDGKHQEVEVVANLYDEDGHAVIQCNIRDITERKRSEAALRASDTKLHLGAAVAGLGLATFDYVADTIALDETAASLYGLPANSPLPRHEVHARFHPQDAAAIVLKIDECLEGSGDGFMAMDHRILRTDGTTRWVSARKQIEFSLDADKIKRPTTGLLALHDITDRINATALIQESEARMRLATAATGVGIWEWNVLTGRIAWDRQMFRIYGAPPSEDGYVTYDTWRNAVLADDLPGQELLLQDVIRKPRESKRLFRIRRYDGEGVRTIEAVDTSRANAAGQIEWVIGTNLDITYRQEAALKLAVALTAAEKSNQAKSNFLSSMSHELRSPLHAILGFTQLIESGAPPPTPAQKNSIDQILQAGWYLLELINEILDLAMIESGKISLSTEATSLAEILDECDAMVEAQAQKLDVKMVFPSTGCRQFISADRTRVKQVFVNLLSNAIKYNRVGGTVTVTHSEPRARRTRIHFRDTGEGLSPEKLSQLFQPFNRLGQDLGTTEGTGIGLALSKNLVELMGGEIGVESTVGVGSVFWVELDSAADPAATDIGTPPAAATPTPLHGQAALATRTLLYVEDNPANLMLVERLIARRPDICLLTASDGLRGIEIARASQPQVILMDINLPGMSGIDALQILATDHATAHIPVVALSANAMPRDIETGLAAGFFRYVTKPIRVNEFMATLDTAFDFAATISAGTQNAQTPGNP